MLDIGSRGTPILEWFRAPGVRLVSLDLVEPYHADGVESVTADFLEWHAERFDLVLCLQVLEHVPDAGAFALKLLAVAETLVVSVPYRWRPGACKEHVHDPVDEGKMRAWFRREPVFSYLAREPRGTERLVQVYG